AESHDALDSGAVVPTAVEEDDLTCCRKVRQVALDVELRFLALGGGRQRDDAKHPGAYPFCDRLDDATLAGGIATLEDHHDSQSLVLYPQLEFHELAVQLLHMRLVLLVLHLLALLVCRGSSRFGALARRFRRSACITSFCSHLSHLAHYGAD